MRLHPQFILSLAFLLSVQSWLLTTVVVVATDSRGSDIAAATTIATVDIDPTALLAAQNAEELQTRLQDHVAAQVNKLLSDRNLQQAGTGGSTQKLELKIDLPSDLAALVNNGGALKFHRKENGELGDLKESIINVVAGGGKAVRTIASPAGASSGNDVDESTLSKNSSTEMTLCPLGTYSDTGFATANSECRPCPEGETTIRLGSDSCQVVTEEDLLGMVSTYTF